MPGIGNGLNMAQSQAQWDAIASIQANSPFANDSASQSSGIGATLDSMLASYGSTSPTSGTGDETLAAITQRVREAQQSTIDLFA